MQEEILTTTKIYDGRVIKLSVHDVRLPDGNEAQRELVYHPGAVALVAVDSESKLLMVRQYRIAARRVMLEVPAGTLEMGEQPDVCAVRELQEETGYKPGQLHKLGGIFVAPGYTTEYIHLYLATDLSESSLDGDLDEFIQVERFTFSEVLTKIESGEIEDAKTITAILRAWSLIE